MAAAFVTFIKSTLLRFDPIGRRREMSPPSTAIFSDFPAKIWSEMTRPPHCHPLRRLDLHIAAPTLICLGHADGIQFRTTPPPSADVIVSRDVVLISGSCG
jgi:hypothetical protein